MGCSDQVAVPGQDQEHCAQGCLYYELAGLANRGLEHLGVDLASIFDAQVAVLLDERVHNPHENLGEGEILWGRRT